MPPKANDEVVAERQRLKDAAFYLCMKAQMCKGTNDLVRAVNRLGPHRRAELHGCLSLWGHVATFIDSMQRVDYCSSVTLCDLLTLFMMHPL